MTHLLPSLSRLRSRRAPLDSDDHAGAVDVGGHERDHLAGTQAGAIGYAQRRLCFSA